MNRQPWITKASRRMSFPFIALLLLGACSSTPTAAPTGSTSPAVSGRVDPSLESYKIGAVLPLTGAAATAAAPAWNAAQLVADEINAAGGVKGHKLEVIAEDSKGEPQTGVAAFLKLINIDKTTATVMLNSGVIVACIPVAEREHRILFDLGSTSPQVGVLRKDYTFSNYPKADVEGAREAEFAYNTLKARTAAMLSVNVESGQGQRAVIVKRFQELGGKILEDLTYLETEKSFQTLLTRVKAANPEIIFLASQEENALIVKQARELGMTTRFASFSAIVTQRFLDAAGASAAEGTVGTSVGWNPNDTSPLVKNFIAAYKARFNSDPNVYSATIYDAIKLIAKGMEQNGNTADGIKAYLYTVKDFPGVSGTTTIQSNGLSLKPVYFKIVKNGQWVDYAP